MKQLLFIFLNNGIVVFWRALTHRRCGSLEEFLASSSRGNLVAPTCFPWETLTSGSLWYSSPPLSRSLIPAVPACGNSLISISFIFDLFSFFPSKIFYCSYQGSISLSTFLDVNNKFRTLQIIMQICVCVCIIIHIIIYVAADYFDIIYVSIVCLCSLSCFDSVWFFVSGLLYFPMI